MDHLRYAGGHTGTSTPLAAAPPPILVNEEIIVQRRPADDGSPREHVVVNRAADAPPVPRK